MSANLEQTDGKEGIGGEVMGPPPQPAKPKEQLCNRRCSSEFQ